MSDMGHWPLGVFLYRSMCAVRLLDLNRGTTVVRERRDGVYTTLSLGDDVVAVNAHLNEFVGYSLSTLFRELLVELGATGLAVGVAGHENLAAVSLGIFSYFLHVNEVFAAGNLRRTDVEEYRLSGGDNLSLGLNCGDGLLVGEHIAETGVLVLLLFERSVESVELLLVHGHESVYVRSLLPSVLAEVVGHTYREANEFVVTTGGKYALGGITEVSAIDEAFTGGAAEVSEDLNAAAHAEVVEQTEVVGQSIFVGAHVAHHTHTNVRNEVPHALLVVTEEEVREVEGHVFVDVPVVVRVVVVAGVNLLGPDAVELGAETNAGSEPLTYGNVEAEGSAVYAERVLVAAVFLRSVGCGEVSTGRYVPVCPERVGGYAVLVGRDLSLLSHGGGRETYYGKCE